MSETTEFNGVNTWMIHVKINKPQDSVVWDGVDLQVNTKVTIQLTLVCLCKWHGSQW